MQNVQMQSKLDREQNGYRKEILTKQMKKITIIVLALCFSSTISAQNVKKDYSKHDRETSLQ